MSSTNLAPIVGTMTVTSGAGGTTTAGTTVEGLAGYEKVTLLASLVGVGGGALDVYVQTRHGAIWYDYCHFTQLGAGAAAVMYRVTCSRYGTTATPVVIGSGVAPALAANTLVNGDFGDAMRVLVVAGAGAAAGGVESIAVAGTYPIVHARG